jgi:hypothetical protein
LPETLAAAITRGAPAAVDAAAGLAGGLADVLGMDTASLGAEAGLGWIDAMIKAIESRLPALQAAASEVWSSLGGQAGGAGFAGRPAVAEAGGGRSEARGGPVTINLYGPWQVSNEMDAQQVAEIIGEVLAGRAITNKRMNVAWATAGVA